ADDLVVAIDDPLVLARWHMGRVSWAAALRSGGVTVSGPRALRQALPTWNGGPAGDGQLRGGRGRAGLAGRGPGLAFAPRRAVGPGVGVGRDGAGRGRARRWRGRGQVLGGDQVELDPAAVAVDQ